MKLIASAIFALSGAVLLAAAAIGAAIRGHSGGIPELCLTLGVIVLAVGGLAFVTQYIRTWRGDSRQALDPSRFTARTPPNSIVDTPYLELLLFHVCQGVSAPVY